MKYKMLLNVFAAAATIGFLQNSAGAATLIDLCYTAQDTDSSAMDQPGDVRVKISSDDRGYLAEIINVGTGGSIATQIPVAISGARGNNSWVFRSFSVSDHGSSQTFILEIYRTSLKPRTPTMVNAHLSYFDQATQRLVILDRLECRKI